MVRGRSLVLLCLQVGAVSPAPGARAAPTTLRGERLPRASCRVGSCALLYPCCSRSSTVQRGKQADAFGAKMGGRLLEVPSEESLGEVVCSR